eukprot:gene24909-30093_t
MAEEGKDALMENVAFEEAPDNEVSAATGSNTSQAGAGAGSRALVSGKSEGSSGCQEGRAGSLGGGKGRGTSPQKRTVRRGGRGPGRLFTGARGLRSCCFSFMKQRAGSSSSCRDRHCERHGTGSQSFVSALQTWTYEG